jgi:CRP-like cAMP-binding protein
MFWVQSGEARLCRTSLMGSEIVFQRARRGFLAEASYDQSAYHCDGVAVQNTRVLALRVEHFRAALATTDLRDMWLRHLSQELRRVRAHSERLSLRTANDRIIHFIETEGSDGQIVLSQSKKSWASELGLTHEALYRSLRTMMDDGILETSGNIVRLRVLQKC